MQLNTIKPGSGAKQVKRRVGRGIGSGLGKTAGRGHKGQKSRAGGFHKVGFEGGQMPLQRRLPKRGFTNPFRVEVESVNLDDLDRAFESGVVDPEAMRDRGVVPRKAKVIKVLGRGELSKALTVKAHRFSESARAKIVAAGGVAETLGGPAKETTAEAK